MATKGGDKIKCRIFGRFQSLGVTKDWRPDCLVFGMKERKRTFPVNRRQQGLATSSADFAVTCSDLSFQSIGVTKDWRPYLTARKSESISGGRFQSIGVTKDWRHVSLNEWVEFLGSFKSIGVTMDWRPGLTGPFGQAALAGFQSIAVTKDWRPHKTP